MIDKGTKESQSSTQNGANHNIKAIKFTNRE